MNLKSIKLENFEIAAKNIYQPREAWEFVILSHRFISAWKLHVDDMHTCGALRIKPHPLDTRVTHSSPEAWKRRLVVIANIENLATSNMRLNLSNVDFVST